MKPLMKFPEKFDSMFVRRSTKALLAFLLAGIVEILLVLHDHANKFA
jgi:hypothetical protein